MTTNTVKGGQAAIPVTSHKMGSISSPTATSSFALLASSHGTPVYITVWDLLPPSGFSNLSKSLLGIGVFHTNVWIPDLDCEYAFGGHDVEDVTGIFALPCDSGINESAEKEGGKGKGKDEPRQPHHFELVDGLSHRYADPAERPAPGQPPFPGARYIGAYFIGYAGAPEDDEAERARESSSNHSPPATFRGLSGSHRGKGTLLAGMNLNGRWAAPQTGADAFKEPGVFVPHSFSKRSPLSVSSDEDPTSKTHGSWSSFLPLSSASSNPQSSRPSSSSGKHVASSEFSLALHNLARHPKRTGPRARSLTHVLRVLSELKSLPEWHGTSYDLLSHNCNHFTDTFLRRLCGDNAHLPNWINRAAWLGEGVQRLIPQRVLEGAVGLITAVENVDTPGMTKKAEEEGGEEGYVERAKHNIQREGHAAQDRT